MIRSRLSLSIALAGACATPSPTPSGGNEPGKADGVCTATCADSTIAANSQDVVVHGGFLYYVDGLQIVRRPLAGGTPTALVDTLGLPNDSFPLALAVDDATIYYVGIGSIWSAPVTGGTPTRLFQGESDFEMVAIATDDDHVYWGANGALVRMAKIDGTIDTAAVVHDDITDIAVDADDVYFTAPHIDATVWRYRKATGALDYVPGQAGWRNPQRLALTDSDVYVAAIVATSSPDLVDLLRVSRATSEVEELARLAGTAGPVLVDESNLYWTVAFPATSESAGAILWRPLGGSVDTEIDIGRVRHLASDASFLYWTGFSPPSGSLETGALSKCGCGM
jgi:hypothetical protein